MFSQYFVSLFCVQSVLCVIVLCSVSTLCHCFVFSQYFVSLFCVQSVLCVIVLCSAYTLYHSVVFGYRGNLDRAVTLFERAISLAKTEVEMEHLCSLLQAAMAQSRVASKFGIQVPTMGGVM